MPKKLNAQLVLPDGQRKDFGAFDTTYEARELCEVHAQVLLSWRLHGNGIWEARSPQGVYKIGERSD